MFFAVLIMLCKNVSQNASFYKVEKLNFRAMGASNKRQSMVAAMPIISACQEKQIFRQRHLSLAC